MKEIDRFKVFRSPELTGFVVEVWFTNGNYVVRSSDGFTMGAVLDTIESLLVDHADYVAKH